MSHSMLRRGFCFAALVATPAWGQQKVGDVVPLTAQDFLAPGQGSSTVRLDFPDPSFVRLHFASVDLAPGDSLELQDGSGTVREVYRDTRRTDVWSTIVYEQPVMLVLRSASGATVPGYLIDQVVQGDPPLSLLGPCDAACGRNIECVGVGTVEYARREPICRFHFIRQGQAFVCTGWLIGSPDCLITNWHCTDGAGVNTMLAEFNYECDRCTGGTCKPTTTYSVEAILLSDSSLDFSLLDLTDAPARKWGILPVNTLRPRLHTGMYEIHHSRGAKKGINYGRFFAFVQRPDTCLGVMEEVYYTARADKGASGSPVLCRNTNLVEALCHCAVRNAPPGCQPGAGVPMSRIAPVARPVLDAHGCGYRFLRVPCGLRCTGSGSGGSLAPALSAWGLIAMTVLLL